MRRLHLQPDMERRIRRPGRLPSMLAPGQRPESRQPPFRNGQLSEGVMEKDSEIIRQCYLEHRAPIEEERTRHAKETLESLGFQVKPVPGKKALTFAYKGSTTTLFPYKGWFSGKGVTPGRGLNNLLRQLR